MASNNSSASLSSSSVMPLSSNCSLSTINDLAAELINTTANTNTTASMNNSSSSSSSASSVSSGQNSINSSGQNSVSTCSIPPTTTINVSSIADVSSLLNDEQLTRMIEDGRAKLNDFTGTLKTLENVTNRLQLTHTKAQSEINEAYQFYVSILEETKHEFLKELDDIFNSRMVSLTLLSSKVEEAIRKTQQILFMDRPRKFTSSIEMLQYKQEIDSKLQAILNFNPDINIPSQELEFVSNYQAIQVRENSFSFSLKIVNLFHNYY